jgi:hypothetical protein
VTAKRPKLLVISGGVSSVTEAPERPATDETTPASRPSGALRRAAPTVGLAAVLVAIAFVTGGGVDQNVASAGNTWTEIALIALGALAVAAGLLRRAPGEQRPGWVTAAMMGLLFADIAASIAWSWAPDASWIGASQMLAYLSVFAGVIMLARPWARGWPAVLGALALWSATLCAWSLLVKVFPSALAAGNQFGRLQAPFGYWNAIALCAAMGLPCCLWLGARREGGRHLAALAAPALTLLISVLVLSYSRSADAAAAVAAGVWLIAVPLRLRAIAMLLIGAFGGAVLSVWFLTHHGLAGNYLRMSAQDHAGHLFGIVLLVVLVLVSVAGVAVSEAMDRSEIRPATRRRIGSAVVAALILGVLASIVGVALSSRGLTGEISYRWHELTNPAATVSAGNASRVFQFGSSRPLYWHEALFVGKLAYWKGVGELGFSVARSLDPQSAETVFQAHSYVFQTYADLGALGLLLSAGLLASWLLASGRAISFGRAWETLRGEAHAERIALITLVSVVIGFGVQSTLDWTWYFSGLAVPVLLAAGWVAGRGAGTVFTGPARSPLDRPGALVTCAGLAVAVVIGGWLTWRPLHSAQLVNSVSDLGQAQAAQQADPFSLDPYQAISTIDLGLGRGAAAVAAAEQGTQEQPHNAASWEQLSQVQQQLHNWPAMLAAAQRARSLAAAANYLQWTAISLQDTAEVELQAQAKRAAKAKAALTARHSRTASGGRTPRHRHR